MELKSAEREVQELEALYLRVRRYDGPCLPRLEDDDDHGESSSPTTPTGDNPVVPVAANGGDNESLPVASATEALRCLEDCRDRTFQLRERISKLEKRRGETDPVTGRPRYGEQTLARVGAVVKRYQRLESVLLECFPTRDGEPAPLEEPSAIRSIRQAAQLETEEARRSQEREQSRRREEEQERQSAERHRVEQEQLRMEEEARLEEQRLAELARVARETRLAAMQAREEAERADRLWVLSIDRGVDGVKRQLSVLLESAACDADPSAPRIAVEALHTLFSQIVAHPEEPNFRRIRRDHGKFNADIGRHNGGRELLIAAGFELGAIDDVPCFLSKEPNIEKDMDGWAAWFDLLKGTLAVLEEQLIALP